MGKNAQSEVIRAFSAGGVVCRGSLWLVTKSSQSDKFPKSVWRLPKGTIDGNDTPEETAIREVEEEGGIKAKIIKKIGTEKYLFTLSNQKYLKFVTFYLMEWQEDLFEGFGFETSEVAWLPFDQAYKKLDYKGEKEILKKAKEVLET